MQGPILICPRTRIDGELIMDLKVKGRYMRSQLLSTVLCVLVSAGWAPAQQPSSCANLMNFKPPKVEITKAAPVSAGSTDRKWRTRGCI